jgi:hypothetical protein
MLAFSAICFGRLQPVRSKLNDVRFWEGWATRTLTLSSGFDWAIPFVINLTGICTPIL